MNLTKSEFCAMLCRAIEANDPDGTLLPYLTDARADAFYALTEQMNAWYEEIATAYAVTVNEKALSKIIR